MELSRRSFMSYILRGLAIGAAVAKLPAVEKAAEDIRPKANDLLGVRTANAEKSPDFGRITVDCGGELSVSDRLHDPQWYRIDNYSGNTDAYKITYSDHDAQFQETSTSTITTLDWQILSHTET